MARLPQPGLYTVAARSASGRRLA